MDQGPLVEERIAAGEQFLREFDKIYPVAVAFWLKKPAGRWRLHVASPKLTEATRAAYDEVVKIVRAMQNPDFATVHISLGKMTDWPVERALELQRWRDVPIGHVFPVESFGALEVEAAYIYPPLKSAAA